MADLLSLNAFLYFTVAAVLLLPLASAQTSCTPISPKIAPVVASDYTASVLMNGLKTPRGMLFDSQGNLLIVEQGGAGVRLVKLTDGGGMNVCVASSKQLIADATVCGLKLRRDFVGLHLRSSFGPGFISDVIIS